MSKFLEEAKRDPYNFKIISTNLEEQEPDHPVLSEDENDDEIVKESTDDTVQEIDST